MAIPKLQVSVQWRGLRCLATSSFIWPWHWYSSGNRTPWGPIYALSDEELSVLKEYIKEMLDQGKICASMSLGGEPILFVPKPHGRGLPLCVLYRSLNSVPYRNWRPLPLMNNVWDNRVLESLVWSTSRLDFTSSQSRRGKSGKQHFVQDMANMSILLWHSVLQIPQLHSKMQWRQSLEICLIEDSSSNGLLSDLLRNWGRTYPDSPGGTLTAKGKPLPNSTIQVFMIYLQSWISLIHHVLGRNQDAQDMIGTILEWAKIECKHNVQILLGFGNFYGQFIVAFARKMKPITDHVRNVVPYEWSHKCAKAFQDF